MGYETKLIIGQIYEHSTVEENGAKWFSKMAMVDLCKCGYEGSLPLLIQKATDKFNLNNYQDVYWSNTISINEDKVTPSLIESGISEDIIPTIYDKITDWESEVIEDCYGSRLRAIPFNEVYEALKKSNAESIVRDGYEYRRYTMALGLFEGIRNGFNGGEDLFVVCYGY